MEDYFEEFLNARSGENSVPDTLNTVDLLVEEPTLVEVKTVTKRLKNKKASGKVNITSECIKYGG